MDSSEDTFQQRLFKLIDESGITCCFCLWRNVLWIIMRKTQLYEDGLETKSLEDIKYHISERRTEGLILGDMYFAFDLVPSFYLDEE